LFHATFVRIVQGTGGGIFLPYIIGNRAATSVIAPVEWPTTNNDEDEDDDDDEEKSVVIIPS
jgi:hypothetical protein